MPLNRPLTPAERREQESPIPSTPTPSFPTGAGDSDTSWLRDEMREGLYDAEGALDQYGESIAAINNRGAGRRLEDALSFARGNAAQQSARAGFGANTLQGAQLGADVIGSAMSDAFAHEGERESQMRQIRAGHYGQLGSARVGLFNSLGGLQAQSRGLDQQDRALSQRDYELRMSERQLRLQEEDARIRRQIAMADLQLQQFQNPFWRAQVGIGGRPGFRGQIFGGGSGGPLDMGGSSYRSRSIFQGNSLI